MKNKILLPILSIFLLGACGVETDLKQQSANQIARPAFMVERTIKTDNFEIAAWERMHQRGAVATIYIEGDNINQIDETHPTLLGQKLPYIGSTPNMPLALYLASRDKSENLVHLARPCQYLKMAEDKGCDKAYWVEKRYTPEVIAAYEQALNDIAARYDIKGFNLVGYDGGANIAAVLAGTHHDILSLRTVAGDLNPHYQGSANEVAKIIPLSANSVYGTSFAGALAKIPQHHFIGAADKVITPASYHSYRQALGLSECIHYSVVQDADHINGWVEKWPELLQVTPQCPMVHDLGQLPPPAVEFPNQDNYKGLSKFK